MSNIILTTDDIIDKLDQNILSDLVWENTLAQAHVSGISPGTEEFLELYNNSVNNLEYGEQYNHQTAFYALTLIQNLLASGHIGIVSNPDIPDSEKQSLVQITKTAYRIFKYVVTTSNQTHVNLMFTDADYEDYSLKDEMQFEFPLDTQEIIRKGAEDNDNPSRISTDTNYERGE